MVEGKAGGGAGGGGRHWYATGPASDAAAPEVILQQNFSFSSHTWTAPNRRIYTYQFSGQDYGLGYDQGFGYVQGSCLGYAGNALCVQWFGDTRLFPNYNP